VIADSFDRIGIGHVQDHGLNAGRLTLERITVCHLAHRSEDVGALAVELERTSAADPG